MLSDPLKVAFWNNIPAPYVVDRFNAVAKRGVIDFEAWFSEMSTSDRSWAVRPESWCFSHRMARVRRFGDTLVGIPPRLPAGEWPDIVVSLYAEAPYLMGLMCSHMRRAKTGLWVEVTLDSFVWVTRTRLRETLKRVVFSRADGILTPGNDGRRYAKRYGARDSRIHEVPHVIDAARFSAAAKNAAKRRDELRRRLGLQGVTFVYVGRLLPGKGIDDALTGLRLARHLTGHRLSLLLVGDGPEEEHLREHCAREAIDGVVFAGFRQQDDLADYYAASDVLVFPTRGDTYGLVVDEAMACSLPILSSSAVGEIGARVVNGRNGFVFNAGDASALAARMVELAEDPEMRDRMGAASSDMVAWESPERWAADFEHAVLALAER